MKPERWRQIEGLYQAAMEHDASERENFLDAACSGDEELRREVESLFVANEQVKIRPAVDPAPATSCG
jgi:eukaryotic-like serine/threonine-protein kinase